MKKQSSVRLGLVTLVALSTALLSACVSRADQTAAPALLVDLTEQNRQQLAAVVAKALHRDKVLLAPDALTQTNQLIITRAPKRTLTQNPVMGRSEENAEYFELLKKGDSCFLLLRSSQQLYPLKGMRCNSNSGE